MAPSTRAVSRGLLLDGCGFLGRWLDGDGRVLARRSRLRRRGRLEVDQVRDLAQLTAQRRAVLALDDVARTPQAERLERLLRGVLLADRALVLTDDELAHVI